MCLLGAKPGSKLTTVFQTDAHNLFTGIGDCDFSRWHVRAHARVHGPADLAEYEEGINYMQMHVELAYKMALKLLAKASCVDCDADPVPATVREHGAPPPNWKPIDQDPDGYWHKLEGGE